MLAVGRRLLLHALLVCTSVRPRTKQASKRSCSASSNITKKHHSGSSHMHIIMYVQGAAYMIINESMQVRSMLQTGVASADLLAGQAYCVP